MGLGKALEDLMSNQPLFQVTNHHEEACGVPPQIDEQTFPGVYRSYFENQNGEQVIFLYDYEQECGTLYMGDAGWEHPYEVVDGKVPELTLNRPEQTWLSACWEASGALKRRASEYAKSIGESDSHTRKATESDLMQTRTYQTGRQRRCHVVLRDPRWLF